MSNYTLIQLENMVRITRLNLKSALTPPNRTRRVPRYLTANATGAGIKYMRNRISMLEEEINSHPDKLNSEPAF